jgi:hypothetical protein
MPASIAGHACPVGKLLRRPPSIAANPGALPWDILCA